MQPAASRSSRPSFFTIAALSLLCIAGYLRFSSLSNLPGINADEADMGVHILDMASGKPFFLRSTRGQYFNPIYVVSETVLFKFVGHDFYLLRLPAAVFSVLGIFILIYLYGRSFNDWPTAWILGALLVCFPSHLIWSRLGWDPTFMLFWTPVLLYLALRLFSRPTWRDAVLMAVAILLGMWTHATMGLFVLAIGAAILWVRRREANDWLAQRLPCKWARIFAPGGLALFAWFLILCIAIFTAVWYEFEIDDWPIRALSLVTTMHVLWGPGALVAHARAAGDLVSAYGSIRYVVGTRPSTLFAAFSWGAEFFLLACALKLAFAKNSADRFLATLLFFYLLLILMAAGLLNLQEVDHLRYVLPLIVLAPLIFVRALPTRLWLLVCVLMLVQYWCYFAQPTLQCRYRVTEDPTYWTGIHEPKAAAADLLLRLARAEPTANHPTVYTSRYWIERPLQLLLYGRLPVTHHWPGAPASTLVPGDFVAGFVGEDFLVTAERDLQRAGATTRSYIIRNQAGVDQIMILQLSAISPATKGIEHGGK